VRSFLLGEVSGNHSVIRQFMGAEKNDGLTQVFDFGMRTLNSSASISVT